MLLGCAKLTALSDLREPLEDLEVLLCLGLAGAPPLPLPLFLLFLGLLLLRLLEELDLAVEAREEERDDLELLFLGVAMENCAAFSTSSMAKSLRSGVSRRR